MSKVVSDPRAGHTVPAQAATNGAAIKLLAVMEATTVTGPAKNLINFCRSARNYGSLYGLPTVETSIVTFHRGQGAPSAQPRGGHAPFTAGGEAPNQFVAAAREAEIKVDVIAERFRFDRQVVDELRRVVALRAPDIIQTHHVKSHFLLKVSGLWRQYPWVAFHHGYTTTNLRMHAYNQLDRWSLPSAERVVTVCDSFARDLARAGVRRERIFVRHNSVRPPERSGDEVLSALRERLGVGADQRVLITVGRLSREKGHVDLISALSHLHRSQPELDFKLIIVGDGPERQRVERAAASLGLAGRVVFAGHVSNVRPYYEMAHALALPSHTEGSPNVLLEAMAAGVPVVAAAVGGIPEIVTHDESALLVAPRDPQALGTAIGRVLTDARLASRLATSASALAAARYSPESYLRSLLGLYGALTPGAAGAGTQVNRAGRAGRRG